MRLLQLVGIATLAIALTGHAQDKGAEYPNALEGTTVAGDFAPLFPFKITHGLPGNITNVQTWDGPCFRLSRR